MTAAGDRMQPIGSLLRTAGQRDPLDGELAAVGRRQLGHLGGKDGPCDAQQAWAAVSARGPGAKRGSGAAAQRRGGTAQRTARAQQRTAGQVAAAVGHKFEEADVGAVISHVYRLLVGHHVAAGAEMGREAGRGRAGSALG